MGLSHADVRSEVHGRLVVDDSWLRVTYSGYIAVMNRMLHAFATDRFDLPLPPGHRFPFTKYRLLRERLEASALVDLMRIAEPEAASYQQLQLVHEPSYIHRLKAGELSDLEQRRIGLPWSPQLVERSCRSTGATIAAARAAMDDGAGIHLAGGTHHAFPDHGQGFCVFNDVAVAIRVLQEEGVVQRAIVIDCDVHQGNGTAYIFREDESVFTFSMHGERNFPFAKCDGDFDIALPDGTTDSQYLALLEDAVAQLPLADAQCVFYLAGADPYQEDRYGRLNLSKQGLADRDHLVLSACRNIRSPVVVLMAGGYARQIDEIVDIHTETVRLTIELHVNCAPCNRST